MAAPPLSGTSIEGRDWDWTLRVEEAAVSSTDASARLRVLCRAWLCGFRGLLCTKASLVEESASSMSYNRANATFTHEEKHRAIADLLSAVVTPDPAHVRAKANAQIGIHLRDLLMLDELSGAHLENHVYNCGHF